MFLQLEALRILSGLRIVGIIEFDKVCKVGSSIHMYIPCTMSMYCTCTYMHVHMHMYRIVQYNTWHGGRSLVCYLLFFAYICL